MSRCNCGGVAVLLVKAVRPFPFSYIAKVLIFRGLCKENTYFNYVIKY